MIALLLFSQKERHLFLAAQTGDGSFTARDGRDWIEWNVAIKFRAIAAERRQSCNRDETVAD